MARSARESLPSGSGVRKIRAVTTTSGLWWKIPGRVGDSPILGAGLYVDGDTGAAGSTGRGEANLYNLCSFLIVENLREGMHPKDAGLDACKRIKANTVPRLRERDENFENVFGSDCFRCPLCRSGVPPIRNKEGGCRTGGIHSRRPRANVGAISRRAPGANRTRTIQTFYAGSHFRPCSACGKRVRYLLPIRVLTRVIGSLR